MPKMEKAMSSDLELVTLEEAARVVGKIPHNIRDYIQHKRIGKYNEDGESVIRARNGGVCAFP